MNTEIQNALSEIENPLIKEAIARFANEGRAFALGDFCLQDKSKSDERKLDLLGGFPYTSEVYPWPIAGENGLFMQPLIQINLKAASELLKFDFGEGLLQLWGLVAKDESSLNKVELAFDSDTSKAVFMRIIPIQDTLNLPSDFYPDFAPWLNNPKTIENRNGATFIKATQPMSEGSTINWIRSTQKMYPSPHYELHSIVNLITNDIDDDVDTSELFDELRSTVNVFLKTPQECGNFYLGGVRGYGDGRNFDPAQGFPVLVSLSGEISLSVIYDESIEIKPTLLNDGSKTQIHFPRQMKLRVVYSYDE